MSQALLDTGYERDPVIRIQSLLLLTWWWDKKDDGGRNMRSCTVDAINTAQSLGMHRWYVGGNPVKKPPWRKDRREKTNCLRDHYPTDDVTRVRLWKRIWWTCFVCVFLEISIVMN